MEDITSKIRKHFSRGKKIFMKKYQPLKTPIEMGKQRARINKLLSLPKCTPRCIERVKPVIIGRPKTRDPKRFKNRVHPESFDNYEVNGFYLRPRDHIFFEPLIKKPKKPDPFIMSEFKTICDTDPFFYKVIDGRPIRAKVDIKSQIFQIRQIALQKQDRGYIEDQILKLDFILESGENETYHKILIQYYKICLSFQQFVRQSLESAIEAQSLAEQKFEELQIAMEVLEDLSYNYNKLRNEVANLTIRLDILTTYRKFLLEISPIWWRAKHDDTCFLYQNLFATSKSSTSQIYQETLGTSQAIKLELYFTRPEQVGGLFESIQKQCLNYMQIRVMERSVLDPLLRVKDQLKQETVSEIKFIYFLISKFTDDINMMEENEQTLQSAFFSLLTKKFRQLYLSFQHTKLFICLQYINTKVLENVEDPNDSVKFLMRLIERSYENTMLALENLDQTVVKKATREAIAYDKFILKRANIARATLKQFNNMQKALYSSFEPPRHFKRINWKVLKGKGKY